MMENNSKEINRYSDKELLEFKELIDQKLKSTSEQLQSLTSRAENISESGGNDGDWIDNSANMQDLNMLYNMIGRQRKYVQQLEYALIRIRNKNFGICSVSGQLIDKRRLMAVPTTTKSLAAKIDAPEKKRQEIAERKKVNATKTPTSFSRIIKRTGGAIVAKAAIAKDNYFDDEDDDEEINLDFEDSKNLIDSSYENEE